MPIANRSRQRRVLLALVTGANGAPFSSIAEEHTHSTYINYHCRCDDCRAANAAYQRKRVRAKKEQEASRLEGPRASGERLLTQDGETGEQEQDQPSGEAPVPVPAPPQTEPVTVVTTTAPPTRRQWPVPPITDAVADRITTKEFYDDVVKAYYEPEITMPQGDGRTRRVAGNAQVIVGADKTIIWVAETERTDGPSELLQDRKRAMPKARGGRGGSRGPSDWSDLMRRLRRSGCSVERTSNHIRVVSQDGVTTFLPSTASDHRALANAVAQLRKDGFDVD